MPGIGALWYHSLNRDITGSEMPFRKADLFMHPMILCNKMNLSFGMNMIASVSIDTISYNIVSML